jgi:hypothetical protein
MLSWRLRAEAGVDGRLRLDRGGQTGRRDSRRRPPEPAARDVRWPAATAVEQPGGSPGTRATMPLSVAVARAVWRSPSTRR